MNLPKLAIFDMDGLLLDSERMFMNTKSVIMKKYGYQQTTEDYIKTLGTAGEKLNAILYETYGPEYPANEITAATRKEVNRIYHEDGVPVKEGIFELLDFLRKNNVPCCVATSTAHEFAETYLTLAGLNVYFNFIIGGDEITYSKPNPEIFLKACEKGSSSPENAVVFEDSENGIYASHAANIPVICIPDMKFPCDKAAAMTASIVSSANEAIHIFEL